MSHNSDSYEVARSFEVFTDPKSYKQFDLTKDHMRMVGCIDPRDEQDDDLKVIMQTAGGAVGKGHDAALAHTAMDGEPHSLEIGMKEDRLLQRSTVAGAHGNGCRFILGLETVTREIIDPSDRTKYRLGKLVSRYEHDKTDFYANFSRIQDAAKLNLDAFAEVSADEILETVDDLYPLHPNVRAMNGENRAGFYILNHHPYTGLDRSLVHRGDNPLTVHAYHDSVRATNDSLLGTVGMSAERKGLRLAALFSRIAATQTVLCQNDPSMIYLDVVPTVHGIQVEREI